LTALGGPGGPGGPGGFEGVFGGAAITSPLRAVKAAKRESNNMISKSQLWGLYNTDLSLKTLSSIIDFIHTYNISKEAVEANNDSSAAIQ
jgi:hypothetical protein